MYSDILNDCVGIITNGYKEHVDLNNFKCILYQNKALAYLKLKSPRDCLEACEKCLELDSRNEKCIYRKGEAYIQLGDHEEAEKYFREVLKINEKNSEAAKKVKLCQDVIKQALIRERKMFQNAFKRLGNVSFLLSRSHCLSRWNHLPRLLQRAIIPVEIKNLRRRQPLSSRSMLNNPSHVRCSVLKYTPTTKMRFYSFQWL